MKFVDLGDHREPGIGLYSGNPRGAAVREDVDLDASDAEQEPVTIRVPDDVFAVTASFLSGLLSKSIRTLGPDRFRELFTFEGKSIDDTLDMVVEYASKRRAAI